MVVTCSDPPKSGTIWRIRGPLEFKCQLDSTDGTCRPIFVPPYAITVDLLLDLGTRIHSLGQGFPIPVLESYCSACFRCLPAPTYLTQMNGLLQRLMTTHSLESVSVVQNCISKTFETLRAQMKSESVVLSVCESPIIIWPNKCVVTPEDITPNTLCEEIPQWTKRDEQEGAIKKSAKKKYKKTNVINLGLMMEITKPGPLPAPVLIRTVQKCHFLHTTLPMDCVVHTNCSEPIGLACERLLEMLIGQLYEMEKVGLRHMTGTTLLVPYPLHFLLPESKTLVTVVFPSSVPDSELEAHRRDLHQRFELPEDKPYFRRANAYRFPDEAYKDGYLRNPHLVLNHPTLENGKLYLVQGTYSYHHYMQDRIEDNGWGCAYRSLQTICSWFQQQGYVERAVPSHKEIQQALVDIGDKQAAFVGSRQWIGSIEVQAVLDQLLGVTSKIMFVSQGSELASKGRELANHFLNVGTPIMIGGGVLAHTILGVAWSETTGQIRYLILDPHYTGAEDLQAITDKGWCGWKGPDFWDQTAYYNLCMPQRPKTI